MSTLSIQPTYPVFTDIDGQPLEAGFVYIGVTNSDPQANPISVYWDVELTQLVVQPVRTISGYPSNAGAPARLYTNSNYSIRVTNKNGSIVYSAAEATERLSADLISYQLVGAVTTTVQAKLRETVSVKDFGAVGDGVADDTAAIQAAIDYASKLATSTQFPTDVRGVEVRLGEGVFNISDTLRITTSGVCLIGQSQHSTIIKYVPGSLTTSDYLINLGNAPLASSRMYSNRLEKFSLTHDLPSSGLNSPCGIRLFDVHSWVVKEVRVYGTHQGFYAQSAWVGRLSDSFFIHNYRSVYFNGEVHNVSVRNVAFGRTLAAYATNAISSHLTIRNCWAVEVVACDFEFGNFAQLTTSIYLYNSCRGINISTNYFESNSGYALYVRDESAGNNTECSGVTFTSNFVNQDAGKGIYIRHNNLPAGEPHNIIIEANYVFIDPTEPFIEVANAGALQNSFYRGNYIRQALSECSQPQYFNNYVATTLIATNRCFTPSTVVNAQNLSIGAHSYDFLSFQAVPLSLTTTRSLHYRSAYFVTIVLETGANTHETGLYLVSRYGTSTQVYPLQALSQGTVSVVVSGSDYFVKYDKPTGFSTAVRIVIIPVNGRD